MDLELLAARLDLSKIWVKDESKRFNLNAFKVLGASFAFAKYILGNQEPLEYEDVADNVKKVCWCWVAVTSDPLKKPVYLQDTLLVTATDGNHGYGVAYIAQLFQCKAKV